MCAGMGEISALLDRLSASSHFRRGQHWLLPLHSAISPSQQKAAFDVPTPGVRKIVVSTNIAETSVTIEDVVYVVDTGRHRERRWDGVQRLGFVKGSKPCIGRDARIRV